MEYMLSNPIERKNRIGFKQIKPIPVNILRQEEICFKHRKCGTNRKQKVCYLKRV